MVALSERFPTEIIVGLNNRQPEWHDLYRVNVVTGERTLLLENDRFMQFALDDDYRLRFGSQMTPEGGTAIFRFADGEWQPWDTIPAEDMLTTDLRGFDKAGELLYLADSRGRDTSALVEVNWRPGRKRTLADDRGRCRRRRSPSNREARAGRLVHLRAQTVAGA